MLTVTKTFEFEAAHRLPEYNGACRNVHGHSYKLEVEIVGQRDDIESCFPMYDGMVMDFSLLKKYVQNKVIQLFDHSYINDIMEVPTAENMVMTIVGILKKEFIVVRVRLWETSTSYAEWKEDK